MKQKKHYRKIKQEYYFSHWRGEWKERYNQSMLGKYDIKYSYFRSIHTKNEYKQNCWAIDDGYHVRGRRRNLPNAWDDVRISRAWKRSWKDFTKCKKQYMVNL